MPQQKKKPAPPLAFADAGDKSFAIDYSGTLSGPDNHGICQPMELAGCLSIDPAARGDRFHETVFHEWMHALLPDYEEAFIRRAAKQWTTVVYTTEFQRRAGFA